MKIDSSFKPSPTALGNQPVARPSTPARATSEPVVLSSLASTLTDNEQAPVNNTKVSEIKAAIAEGRFKINAEAITNGLLDMARSLVADNKRQA